MKRITFYFFMVLALSTLLNAQDESVEEFKPSGKVYGKVFLNYHFDASENATPRNSFELKRAYFGYKYNFSKKFSAKLLLDGTKSTSGEGVKPASSYTVFVKNALLDWKANDQVKISAGIIGQTQFNTQEKLFGYRYVHKSMQDQFGMMSTADLGLNAELKLMSNLTANVFVLNGEGYTKVQDKLGRVKVGGNIAYKPVDMLVLKGYYDMYGGKEYNSDSVPVAVDTAAIHTLGFYIGLKTDALRAGIDFTTQMNATKYNAIAEELNRTGIAVNGAYVLNDNIEFFAEYLMLTSNTLEGADDPWNINSNGSILILGIQYSPIKGVKTALNYQGTFSDVEGADPTTRLYLNLELAF